MYVTSRSATCRYRRKEAARDWEQILQTRLSQDVKDKELKQMSRDVSQETLTSSSTSRRVSEASASASLDTTSNVGLVAPAARPKRVITQPPFNNDVIAQQHKLVQSAQEDRELEEESSSVFARAPGLFRQNSANSATNSSNTLVNSSDSDVTDASEARKPVKSAIAMFENLQQSESGRKTTVVVIRRDERGPSDVTQSQNKSRGLSSATGADGSDVTSASSNLKVEVLKLPASQHSATPGSVEAGLYSSVRKVDKPVRNNDVTHAQQRDVSKNSDDDDEGDVKIIEIARL